MRINGRVSFIRYRLDGSIKARGSCADVDFIHQSRVGLFVMEIDDNEIHPLTHYVDVSGGFVATHVMTQRPKMALVLDKTSILADGLDKATISGIPAGATVRAHSTTKTVDDGSIEITSDLDGIFNVSIESFPHIAETITVTAT